MNIKKFTTAKNDIGPTGVVIWSEHLFFEPKRVVNFKFSRLDSNIGNRRYRRGKNHNQSIEQGVL